MSTNRTPRRARVTHHELRQSQKPQCKIADLPEDAQQLIRCLIREWSGVKDIQQATGISLDAAAQRAEYLMEAGDLKIIIDQSPETLSNTEGIRYRIVPTGKY